jgi:hypothetical protein
MSQLPAIRVAAGLLMLASSTTLAAGPDDWAFLVRHNGSALLGANGEEIERLDTKTGAAGALSPDGKWVVFATKAPNDSHSTMVIHSRGGAQPRTTVSLWGGSGSSFLPIWSADSQRILICEQVAYNKNRSRESAYTVFQLAEKTLEEITVPKECWPNDWSRDGKRLLTTVQPDNDTVRLAWVNFDGSGGPEYITGADEVAYSARLSPDDTRILCMLGPKVASGQGSKTRLCVFSLPTKVPTIVDEPGETYGHCWSPDGSKIAYTWQRSLENPADVPVRETFLITCNADGSNRKIVTSRKHEVRPNTSGRDSIVYFFELVDWR